MSANAAHRGRVWPFALIGLTAAVASVGYLLSGAGSGAITTLSAPLPSPLGQAARPAGSEPARAEAPPPAALELAEVELRRGDTVLDVLKDAGIGPAEAYEAVGSLRAVADLRRLKIGQRLGLTLDAGRDGEALLAKLILPVDAATEIHLVRGEDGGFAAESVERALRPMSVAVAATIDDSLYAAGSAAGVPAATLAEIIRLLSWDVDFQRDVQPGDRLEAVFRRLLDERGRAVVDGALDFVGLVLNDRLIEAYRYTPEGGRDDFFDRNGRSLRKWLLKTVVDGARLSSAFGARRHPVLGYTRMHRGIDFAAPTGTPVLAAAAGVVETAGRNRGYGNYVRLRHNAAYGTAYGHLSRFAKGLRSGQRVEQGEVIGYVGATGLATGPHLHYEILIGGRQVNPLGVDVVAGEPLQGAELAHFMALRDRIDGERRTAAGPMADGRPRLQPPATL